MSASAMWPVIPSRYEAKAKAAFDAYQEYSGDGRGWEQVTNRERAGWVKATEALLDEPQCKCGNYLTCPVCDVHGEPECGVCQARCAECAAAERDKIENIRLARMGPPAGDIPLKPMEA